MNHLAHLAEHLVLDPKSFQKRFECAVVTLMRKISLEHVERHNATIRRNFFRKNKLRFGIDELPDQPGGTDAIDLRARAGDPSPTAVISRHNFWNRRFAWLRPFHFAQEHFHILGPWAVEEVSLPDLATLLPDPVEFVAKCRRAPSFAAITQGPKQLAECRVLFRPRGIEQLNQFFVW